MIIVGNEKVYTRKRFILKETFSDLEPSGLKRIASRLEETLNSLNVVGTLVEVSKLIKEFIADIRHKDEDALQIKWSKKKKDLLDILIVVGRKSPMEYLDLSGISEILEKVFLILLAQRRISARYIEAMGRAVLNNMGNQRLRKMLTGILEKENQSLGKRAVIWKRELSSLKNPALFVRKNLVSATPLRELPATIAAENTWFGSRLMREALHQIGSNDVVNNYRDQLIGDYSSKSLRPDNLGMLADLDIEELSSFVNSYCAALERIPANDVFLDYFALSKVMDVPSAGVKWDHPLIHESSRVMVKRYLLGSDFRNAFDHILMHQERKQYWIKWLESGHIRRIRVFGNMSRIRKYKFNCPVASLEFPTLQMDLGSCFAYECGQQGSGALYVYPSEDPLKWDQKLYRTRDYKRHCLDSPSQPAKWLRISHTSHWQLKVDGQLMQHYRLRR